MKSMFVTRLGKKPRLPWNRVNLDVGLTKSGVFVGAFLINFTGDLGASSQHC